MSGDSGGETGRGEHPARKVSTHDLKRAIAKGMDRVHGPTTPIIAQEFSETDPQTVRKNLHALADNEEVCRLNDGNTLIWWLPEDDEAGGDVSFSQLIDDSIDYDDLDPTKVPVEVAEDIALAKLPYYRPRSFWSEIATACRTGMIFSLGLIIVGIASLVAGTFALQQSTAAAVMELGFVGTILAALIYLASLLLHLFSTRGYVSRDPLGGRLSQYRR